MYHSRKLQSSSELPTYPQDFKGVTFQVLERGLTADAYTPWTSSGGAWSPLGPSYVGSLSGLPSATWMALGARAIIDQPAPGGLTRAPAQGAKMNRLKLIVALLADGATKVWRPDGAQTLFNLAGVPGSPAGANFTATGATGIITEFGQLPIGLLSVAGTELYFRLLVGRGATAAGTADVALTIGPTPGTIGTTIAVCPALTANANAVGWIEGSLFVGDTTHQAATYTLTPGAKGNVSASVATTLNLAVAQTLQVSISSASTNDIFNVIAGTVGIR